MNKKLFTVSISVIGYNTKKSLSKLLHSIQELVVEDFMEIEIIYVDDGSSDESFRLFQSFPLKFKKIGEKIENNKGRVAATEKSFMLAKNDWILSVRSNLILDQNILVQYARCVFKYSAPAFMGKILYESADPVLATYLNHPNRGINNINDNQQIHYKNLLFGNCLLSSAIIKQLNFNKKLIAYGGEELDFSYQLNAENPASIRACPLAVATRINHPDLMAHCKRLHEFGKYNFKFLNEENQSLILGGFLGLAYCVKALKLYFVLVPVLRFLILLNIQSLNYYLIRICFFASVCRGLNHAK